MRQRLVVVVVVIATCVAAWAADVAIEDWRQFPVGTKGVPPGWEKQKWGSPKYEFAIVEQDGKRALHMKSSDEGSTITKEVKGRINLKETPILEWSWKAVVLPQRGDSRKKELDDQAAQVFVAWPRFPEAVRSRIIGYVWDSTAPVGTIVKSEKTATVTYVVVRSGPGELNRWLTERRNVLEDFRKIYGEEPESPGGVSLSIDSNDTKSTAESFIGPITFRSK